MVLDICSSSCDSILPNSWIVRLDSSLNLMDFHVFPKSSMIDLVWYPVRNFSTTFWVWPILSSSFRITSCAIPTNLRSTLNSGSSFSTGDSVLRISFQMLHRAGLSVRVPWPSSRTSFLCSLKQNFPMCLAAAAVAAAVIVRLSWKSSSMQRRGVDSLSYKVRSPFWEITL